MNEDYAFVYTEDGLPAELHPMVEDDFDRVAWERFIFTLPKSYTEVVVCLRLGLTPLEVVSALKLKNIGRFYNMSAKLRQVYRERKAKLLGYY